LGVFGLGQVIEEPQRKTRAQNFTEINKGKSLEIKLQTPAP
jgi:hypothetical protein